MGRRFKGHFPTVHQDNHGEFYGACPCGQNSGPNRFPKTQRWKAEDWVREHTEMVRRALSHLHRGGGSVKTERDHARAMLDSPNTPPEDKPLWQILFDGADARLRESAKEDPETEGLW
jgi:hypothetical protein